MPDVQTALLPLCIGLGLLGVVVAALPVLVFGAGLDQLEGVSYLAAGTTLLLVIWLLFAHAGRPWAVVESRESPAAAPSGS